MMIDEIRFLQNHLPGLTAGEYEITIEQEVKSSKITSQTPFTATRKFSVRGDRFALKPTDVQAVFPPAGSLGDHANVLPHILLHRSTLPWERRANPNSPVGEATCMTEPPPCSIIDGMAYLEQSQHPRRLTAMVRSQTSLESS